MDRFIRLRTLLFISFTLLFLGPVLALWACAGEPLSMTLAFMISGAFIAVLVSGGLAAALTEPVLKLTEAAQKMAQGQWSLPVTLRNPVPLEVHALADAFNRMVEQMAQAHQALQANERRFKDFAETAADWFWEMGPDLRFTYLSERYQKITGSDPKQALGHTHTEVFVRRIRDAEALHAYCKLIETRRPFKNMEAFWEQPHASSRVQQLSGVPVFDSSGVFAGYRGSGSDVTEARYLSEQPSYELSHDELTGLFNRREFKRRLKQLFNTLQANEGEHALCFVDLDEFKAVNDGCGHEAGDELLRQMARLLLGRIRKGDIFARLGGDEFGLLLTHCPMQQALRIAENLHQTITGFRFHWDDKVFNIGTSIGLAAITRDSESVPAVLKQADAACYVAKDTGRNRIHAYISGDLRQAKRHAEIQWVRRINTAIEQAQMQLYAQPILPLASGSGADLLHCELMVRMPVGEGRLIAPKEFLIYVERYGLATKLDRYVVQRAMEWLTHSQPKCISLCAINLSGHTLGNRDFLNFLLREFDNCDLSPAMFCFEITETAAISNLVNASVFIETLRKRGCHFALDDFGSGLSSFNYLKSLPVDYLKIDNAFVRLIGQDPIDLAMVKSINEMGHALGKKTIAEGVENQAALEWLRDIGVDYAQGYHISPPQLIDQWPSNRAIALCL
jgi:diguanylate cyclase (GGDEF)-like protein/PAS domain S-box-containing protein